MFLPLMYFEIIQTQTQGQTIQTKNLTEKLQK